MAHVNEFSVKIPQGNEDASGYTALKHGTKYSIVLRNGKQVRCNAKVEIDGKDQGTWRLDAQEIITIERPAHDSGNFTFYQLDSSESQAIGLDGADPNLGLLKVTFTPEKIQHT